MKSMRSSIAAFGKKGKKVGKGAVYRRITLRLVAL